MGTATGSPGENISLNNVSKMHSEMFDLNIYRSYSNSFKLSPMCSHHFHAPAGRVGGAYLGGLEYDSSFYYDPYESDSVRKETTTGFFYLGLGFSILASAKTSRNVLYDPSRHDMLFSILTLA